MATAPRDIALVPSFTSPTDWTPAHINSIFGETYSGPLTTFSANAAPSITNEPVYRTDVLDITAGDGVGRRVKFLSTYELERIDRDAVHSGTVIQRVYYGDTGTETALLATGGVTMTDGKHTMPERTTAKFAMFEYYLRSFSNLMLKNAREYIEPIADPTTGPGLNQAEVDARIRELIADWAEQGNTSRVPADKSRSSWRLVTSFSYTPTSQTDRLVEVPTTNRNAIVTASTGGGKDYMVRIYRGSFSGNTSINQMTFENIPHIGSPGQGFIGAASTPFNQVAHGSFFATSTGTMSFGYYRDHLATYWGTSLQARTVDVFVRG